MTEKKDEGKNCSFCNKHQNQVQVLVQGPSSCICDECVLTCLGIMAEKYSVPLDCAVSGDMRGLPLRDFLADVTEVTTVGDFLCSLAGPAGKRLAFERRLKELQERTADIESQRQKLDSDASFASQNEERLKRQLEQLDK